MKKPQLLILLCILCFSLQITAQSSFKVLYEESTSYDLETLPRVFLKIPQLIEQFPKRNFRKVELEYNEKKAFLSTQSRNNKSSKIFEDSAYLDFENALKYSFKKVRGEVMVKKKTLSYEEYDIQTTEKQKIIAGYNCTHYQLLKSDDTLDLWIAPNLAKGLSCGIYLKNIEGAILAWNNKEDTAVVTAIEKKDELKRNLQFDENRYKVFDCRNIKPKNILVEDRPPEMLKKMPKFELYTIKGKKYKSKRALRRKATLFFMLKNISSTEIGDVFLDKLLEWKQKFPKLRIVVAIDEPDPIVDYVLAEKYKKAFTILSADGVFNKWRLSTPTYIIINKKQRIKLLEEGESNGMYERINLVLGSLFD